MDRETPYSLSVLQPSTDGPDEARTQVQAQLREFILAFQLDNAFIYRCDMLYPVATSVGLIGG